MAKNDFGSVASRTLSRAERTEGHFDPKPVRVESDLPEHSAETPGRAHVRGVLTRLWKEGTRTLANLKAGPQRAQTGPQGVKVPDDIKTLESMTSQCPASNQKPADMEFRCGTAG